MKHTILFLAANPLGTDRLGLDREARAIQVELERSGFRDSFELVTRWAAEPLDLLRELRRLKPTVVHFSGHGSPGVTGARDSTGGPHRDVVVEHGTVDGAAQHGLFFQAADGRPQLVSAEALETAFDAAGSSVKLVVLNACYSEPQAAALLTRVDCVVGMKGSILDDAARSFAIGFYGGLGEQESVAAAYKQGCAAIRLEGLPDADRPQLRTRHGVDAAKLGMPEFEEREAQVVPISTGAQPPQLPEVRAAPMAMPAVPATADKAPIRPISRSSALLAASPVPVYPSPEIEALSKRHEGALARKHKLRDAGLATDEVDREIRALRRELRDGGQLRAGDSLNEGRYLLIKPLGRGGFAVVWEALDRNEQRHVAIKVLHPHLAVDPQRRERFFRGARVMMTLTHSAVVRVYDPRGEDDTFYYFVMEFVPGSNLRDAVLSKRVESSRLLPLILQVGEALAEAHRKQLVHRDVKPQNILLDEHGAAKLTDFDLVGAHDTTGGTRTGALGTVIYAAPECLDRPQEATAQADVFGLGMTAIFCLSGRDLSMATFRNPAATVARLDCSAPVSKVLMQAVEWEPDHRFVDAAAMVGALRHALDRASQHDPADGDRAYPRKFGKYYLLGPLAQGGIGALYLAVGGDLRLERLMVIKTVLPHLADAEYIARFRDDAKVVVKLSHDNLIPVFDAGQVQGELFLAMDLVEGRDLRAIWNRCAKRQVAFPIDVAVYIIKELCRGLAYAHSFPDLHLVHRDISPHNVLVSYTGEVKLTDFGIASSTLKVEKTAPGIIYGKVAYMSPEQARGEKLDGRSDMYAAAIVLWELLTGRQLFPPGKDQPQDLLARAKNPEPMRPSKRAPRVPVELDEICLKALTAAKEDRYADCDGMRMALQSWLAQNAPTTDSARISAFLQELFAEDIQRDRVERDELLTRVPTRALTLPPTDEFA